MNRFDSKLPAVQEPIRVPLNTPVLDAEYEVAAAHVPLSHYLWILRRQGWKMLAFVLLAVVAAMAPVTNWMVPRSADAMPATWP